VWGAEQQRCFEQDGVVRLPGAFPADEAAAMVGAVWRYLESRTDVRRDDRATWPSRPAVSLKRLKRNRVFDALMASETVRAALDGIFGANGWKPPAPGGQVLVTFPHRDSHPWRVPSELWHMDCGFDTPTWPTFAVKLFACIGEVRPRGGATFALAGSHRLVERFGATLDPDDRGGNKRTWGRFMRQTEWLTSLCTPGPEPERSERLLTQASEVAGTPVRVVEMCGAPGDVYITHLHVFHCASSNVNDQPRLMLGKAVLAA
jgi:Phytanoyl-CoA dioxygenase (PhyH)